MTAFLFSCGGKSATSTPAATGSQPETSPAATSPVHEPTESKPERTVITTTKIEILDKISFTEGATLAETSNPILKAIATTLDGNPEIQLLGVQAHAPDLDLAKRRTQAIMDALIERGVAGLRLESQPIASDRDVVEFIVLRRAPDAEK